MDSVDEILNDLLENDTYKTLPAFLDRFDDVLSTQIKVKHIDSLDNINVDFMNEINTFPRSEAILDFGKSMRDLKCVISDSKHRQHEAWVLYVGPTELRISDASVPWNMQNQVYRSLHDIIHAFKRQVEKLDHYLTELDRIQEFCTVMEPIEPTYKHGKRIIVLVGKVWLSLEVSPDGSVRDLRLVGQYCQQNRHLEELLKAWDHDADVATNVMKIKNSMGDVPGTGPAVAAQVPLQVPECAICLYVVLPGENKVPRPLCKNPKCGVYFHENCLYECLIASRPAKFGVAIGTCPACSQPVSCYRTDS